ncbi:MAG: bifunctional hydroxymethylpyrimidine kinase/phosphomethylpyrimidine kinase [Clostridium sp.]|jgi:pyridoxine kinase|nr:bifunctional hydroxymethylpyrimidine kinase/phosphomethylpyrimidine kinase [Clostridium sp.]
MAHDISLALSIAGSETTGGAGIQADLKTFEEYGVHGMVILTSIVTMNPDSWAHEVSLIGMDVIQRQLATVLAGKGLGALKTGMLPGVELIRFVRDTVLEHKLPNVVIDPVLVCKGEEAAINLESAEALRDLLVPVAAVTTPNLFEAGILSGLGRLESVDGIKKAARIICDSGAKHVVIKGGGALDGEDAVDVLYDGKNYEILKSPKVNSPYNQGAGCSFSAAIAAGLAAGLSVREAAVKAKAYVRAAIEYGFAFNRHAGSVYHAAGRVRANKES